MPATDPIMAVLDRVPTQTADRPFPLDAPPGAVRPLGATFAVTPARAAGKHEKTYYTVTVTEATQVYEDGTRRSVPDQVERERED